MVTCLGRYKTNFDYNKLIVQMPLRGPSPFINGKHIQKKYPPPIWWRHSYKNCRHNLAIYVCSNNRAFYINGNINFI